ncbi:AsmA family protein [Alloalcanivorax mobilis]|uniref:DUF748 domain-containing protein n=1 Tax=Alloalcanivorax mobilis TaxID=2019569 RepID=UPI000B5B2007|nr:DUF748 domain-containing protein [Alloalcanivorax mobilis]ASK34292.1 hypothetical protein CEK62_07820 [Alcanivorax sp. N3-2A]|tara:strand:- start:3132 stop:4211 length:1080 start_codon:yes stop_codon:yes gene_type:complete
MKRRYRIPLIGLITLAVLLLALHLALPWLVLNYLNDKLADLGDYRGHVEDVDLAWWRGAYRIEGLSIVKTSGKVPAPLLDAPGIDLAVSWRALWYDHALVARVVFEQPRLNFVDGGDNPDQGQTGAGTDWRKQLQDLVPITLNEVRVENGRFAFRNFTSEPPVAVLATQVNARVTNLTNVSQGEGQGTRVAHLRGTAQVLGEAPLETSADFDPFGDLRDFDFLLRVTDVRLPRLNDLSRAYGNFDFAGGHGDLVMEAHARDGQLSGYIKPLFKDVDVFNWKQDMRNPDKGFFSGLWEALVGGTQTLLKNQRQDQFATRVELNGSVDQSEISTWQAFVAILRNAFIKAFNPNFDSEERDQ